MIFVQFLYIQPGHGRRFWRLYYIPLLSCVCADVLQSTVDWLKHNVRAVNNPGVWHGAALARWKYAQDILEREFNEAEATAEEEEGEGDGLRDGPVGDGGSLAAKREIEEAVFMSSYIPRSLHEVLCTFTRADSHI